MKTLFASLLALFVVAAASLVGQTVTLQFEVASVRATPPSQEHGMTLGIQIDGSQLHVRSISIRGIIAMAYRAKPFQVIGPDWMDTALFDIGATLPTGTRSVDVPEMLQVLLKDRFELSFHVEKREMPSYALVVGKPPLRLERDDRAVDAESADAITSVISGNAGGISGNFGQGSSYMFAGGKFDGKKLTLTRFASELERYADRPIVDMTGLPGAYDISFDVSPEGYQSMVGRAAYNSGMVMPPQMLQMLDAYVSRLPEAIEPLGLRLDVQRLPADVLIIDQVRRTPTEN